MAPQIYPVTLLDSNQVIQYAYDESTQSLRTTATATIVGGDLTVNIDGVYALFSNPTPDNIGLVGHERAVTPTASGQVNRITSITNGTIHSLDIALHNSDGEPIDENAPLFVNTEITASTPTIYNVNAVLANTEYSQTLPIGTKKFTAKIRDGLSKIQYSYTPGGSSTNYVSIPTGAFLDESNLNTTSAVTFYFQSNKPNQVLELAVWS